MRAQKCGWKAGESARKVEKKLRLHQERHSMMRRFGAERARMGSLATSYTKVPTGDGKHLGHVKRKIRHRHSLCWRCVSRRSREHQSKIARYYCDHPVDEHVPVNDCSYVGPTIDSAFLGFLLRWSDPRLSALPYLFLQHALQGLLRLAVRE